jgi:hypothetical protein
VSAGAVLVFIVVPSVPFICVTLLLLVAVFVGSVRGSRIVGSDASGVHSGRVGPVMIRVLLGGVVRQNVTF